MRLRNGLTSSNTERTVFVSILIERTIEKQMAWHLTNRLQYLLVLDSFFAKMSNQLLPVSLLFMRIADQWEMLNFEC